MEQRDQKFCHLLGVGWGWGAITFTWTCTRIWCYVIDGAQRGQQCALGRAHVLDVTLWTLHLHWICECLQHHSWWCPQLWKRIWRKQLWYNTSLDCWHNSIWPGIWPRFWLSIFLACHLAFFPTCIQTIHLTCYLTFLLAFYWAYILLLLFLSDILTFYLRRIPLCYRTFYLGSTTYSGVQ